MNKITCDFCDSEEDIIRYSHRTILPIRMMLNKVKCSLDICLKCYKKRLLKND